MHFRIKPLLLVNVWDVATARILEAAGFSALATTSAGIAFAHGYPDGQKIPSHRMFEAIAEIAAAAEVPVTADVEAGYGPAPEDAARTAQAVIDAGATGMNFEDATGNPAKPLFDLSLQLERIRAIRDVSDKTGVPLVLNARTDVYLLQIGEPAQRYDETLRRASAFRDAEADCIFVPGLREAETIGRLVADLRCPINILGGPGSPPLTELSALGVKRVSLGSGPMRASLGFLRRLADEVRTAGTYGHMQDAPSHARMNDLMSSTQGS